MFQNNWPWRNDGVISVCIFDLILLVLKFFTFSMFDICLFSTSAFFHVLHRKHFLILWKEKMFNKVKPKKNWAAIGGTFHAFKKWKLVENYFKHFFEGGTKLKHLLRLHNLYSQDHFWGQSCIHLWEKWNFEGYLLNFSGNLFYSFEFFWKSLLQSI